FPFSLFFSFFLISRSHHRLAFDNKTTYASQSQSFPLSQPHPFIFPFFYTSCYTLLDNTCRHLDTTTRQPYAPSFISF
ncbi:hypothetical protein V8E52_001203, partial [Russula decolorans]